MTPTIKAALPIAAWAIAATLVLLYAPRTDHKRIDCSMAEHHPDFTQDMKEQCRLARSGRLL
jgi:hypothetical protein